MSDFNYQLLDLYQQIFLVDEPNNIPVKENKKNDNTLLFTGGNLKRILFVYHLPQNWQGNDIALINAVINQGLQITNNDVALLNLFENNTPDWQEIISKLHPQKVIFWGCEAYAESAGLKQAQYIVHSLNSFQYIMVHDAAAYNQNNDLKVKLWLSIKALFNIT